MTRQSKIKEMKKIAYETYNRLKHIRGKGWFLKTPTLKDRQIDIEEYTLDAFSRLCNRRRAKDMNIRIGNLAGAIVRDAMARGKDPIAVLKEWS